MSKSESGQALIMMIVFVVMAGIIAVGTVTVSIINYQSTGSLAQGLDAYYIAEAGAENAILRILKNPAYSGETLTVGSGTATITVAGTATKTIVSTGTSGSFIRKIQAVGSISGGAFTTSSWAEIE